MFTSSEEYIKALHEGDILKFLEWPKWLTQHNLNQDYTQDADATLDLLRGEWLRCGYTNEDTKHIAILFQLLNEENSLLQSIHEYSASALCGAAKQCIVYLEIIQKNTTLTFTDSTLKPYQKNNQLLDEAENKLIHLSKTQLSAINTARKQLQNILLLREMASAYLLFLEQLKKENDLNLPVRIGLARTLKETLDTHTKYDATCNNEISTFINALRKLSPTPIEETDYLSYILPIKKSDPGFFWKSIEWLLSNTDKTTNTESLLLEDDKSSQSSNSL